MMAIILMKNGILGEKVGRPATNLKMNEEK